MPVNDFLPFANSGTANVESQVDYDVDSEREEGNQPGIARSALTNKALRQATVFVSQLADIAMDRLGQDILDDEDLAALKVQLALAFTDTAIIPDSYRSILSGSGTYLRPYQFLCTNANATVGATYTNNGVTYTVRETIAGGDQLIMTGASAPTANGTLTKTAGSGDATIDFTLSAAPRELIIEMVGGGGSGGEAAGGVLSGNAGGATLWKVAGGATFVTAAGGGLGGIASSTGPGAGGSFTVSSPAIDIGSVAGSGGGSGKTNGGGDGGASYFGGQGSGGVGPGTPYDPTAAATNSGSGGGGGGSNSSGGCGGGSGGYARFRIIDPAASYDYAVGAAGASASSNSGAGGSGRINIREIY